MAIGYKFSFKCIEKVFLWCFTWCTLALSHLDYRYGGWSAPVPGGDCQPAGGDHHLTVLVHQGPGSRRHELCGIHPEGAPGAATSRAFAEHTAGWSVWEDVDRKGGTTAGY